MDEYIKNIAETMNEINKLLEDFEEKIKKPELGLSDDNMFPSPPE